MGQCKRTLNYLLGIVGPTGPVRFFTRNEIFSRSFGRIQIVFKVFIPSTHSYSFSLATEERLSFPTLPLVGSSGPKKLLCSSKRGQGAERGGHELRAGTRRIMTLDSSMGSSQSFEEVDEELDTRSERRRLSDSVAQVDGVKRPHWRQLLEILLIRGSAIAGCECGLSFGQLRRFVKLQIGQDEQEEEAAEAEGEARGADGGPSNPFLDRQSTVVVRKSSRRRSSSSKRDLGSDGRDDGDDRELDESDGVIDWDQFGVPEEQRIAASPSSTVTRFFSSSPSRREFIFSSFSSQSSGGGGGGGGEG